MSKLFAPVHDPSLDRWPRRAQPANDDDAAAENRREPQLGPSAPVADAEMRDLVETFERNFAELAPPDPFQTDRTDDLFPGIQELFEPGPQRPRGAVPSLTLAKSGREDTAERVAAAPEARTQVEQEQERERELDEALTLLRGPETERARHSPRDLRDAEPAEKRSAPEPLRAKPAEPAPVAKAASASPAPERLDWAAKSHRHTMVVAAAAIALVVGLSLGYLGARGLDFGKHARIAPTAQGGTQLRLDPELKTPAK